MVLCKRSPPLKQEYGTRAVDVAASKATSTGSALGQARSPRCLYRGRGGGAIYMFRGRVETRLVEPL